MRNMHVDGAGTACGSRPIAAGWSEWTTSARRGPRSSATRLRPVFRGNNIRVITEDAAGFLYIGGGQRLDRFDPATGRVKHFGVAEGFSVGVLLAAHRARDGVLWFGTSTGLARLKPVTEPSTSPPMVLISALELRGLAACVRAG